MTLFTFTGKATVEAASKEEAVRIVAAKLSATARHLGNDVDLEATDPFFSLVEAKAGTAVNDLSRDPIVDARRAAEAQAEADAAAKAGEQQTITADDVGDVADVIGELK